MIDQAKYSYYMKKAQISVIVLACFFMIFGAYKLYSHVDLHMERPVEDIHRELMKAERDREKEIDRWIEPNLSDSERRVRDRDIEYGWISHG